MKNYIAVYVKATGEIIQTSYFDCGDDDFEYARLNSEAAVLAFGAETHDYVPIQANVNTDYIVTLGDRRLVASRPELVVATVDDKTTLTADGVDSITLTGLPDPCDIIIDDPDPTVDTTVMEVTGGGFVFVADDPGVYTVEVRRWPFMPFKIEFTAT